MGLGPGKNGITLPSWMPYHLRNTKESTFSFVLTAHAQLDMPVASSEVASGLQMRGGGAFDSLLFRVSWEKAGDSKVSKTNQLKQQEETREIV